MGANSHLAVCSKAPIGQNLHLRPLLEDDIGPVVDLIGRAMNPAEAREARETFFLHFACKRHGINDGRDYYVLSQDSSVIGVVGLHHYSWGPPENVWLAWFAVEPETKGQGLSQKMLAFALERARQLAYRKLFVETYSTPEFAAARTFYQKMGMVPAGIITPYLPGGGNMIVYYKDLTTHA